MEDFQQNEPVSPRKKRSAAFLWIIGLGGLAITVAMVMFQMKNSVVDYNGTLYLSAKAINITCPQMLDEMTRLDSVTTKVDRIFIYHLTLTKYTKDEVPNQNFCQDWEENILEGLKDNKDMKEFGKNGVTIVYSIKDKASEELCTATFPPGDYYNSAN